MKVLDPGHYYRLQTYPSDPSQEYLHRSDPSVAFMKRMGRKYPDNFSQYDGTNCQELIRVLIDRVEYLDGQHSCPQNKAILMHLRTALYLFEYRAAERKTKLFDFHRMEGYMSDLTGIEKLPPCPTCGHIFPHSHLQETQ